MAKGMYSQGVCLLSDGTTTIQQIKAALQEGGFEVVKERLDSKDWRFGGPTVIIPFRPEVNGYAAVDVVNRPWPDAMGDPKGDATLFGAWGMGQFGPLTFPGNLERAQQHAWAWEPAETIAKKHSGFVRVRMSYVFGGKPDAPVMPKDYDPIAELDFVSRVVMALFFAPGVICYFNPGGEVLRDTESFVGTWNACCEQQKLPLLLWTNIRYFNLNQQFSSMDTVGNGQLDVSDVEAVFPADKYDPGTIDYYLRNVTHYLLDSGKQIQTGEAIDGPGESNLTWTVERLDQSLGAPPRQVLRLYPKASRAGVRQALAGVGR